MTPARVPLVGAWLDGGMGVCYENSSCLRNVYAG